MHMRLGSVLRKYRVHSEFTVREMAAAIGLSAATYSRIERGEDMDGGTLAMILNWLMSRVEV